MSESTDNLLYVSILAGNLLQRKYGVDDSHNDHQHEILVYDEVLD